MGDNFQGHRRDPKRALICPSCQSYFEYRDFLRSRACPSCNVTLGFSVPYRIALAIFAIAVFFYFSYTIVPRAGITLTIVWMIVAAPLALIARLIFVSNVLPRLGVVGLAKCPLCDGVLTRLAIRPGRFNCPHCLKQIRPVRQPGYRWARFGMCAAFAITLARLKGFDWSFLVFVVSVYALPALFFWDILALDLYPPTRFEPTRSPVQILGIGSE
jgi:hypothetical protein